MAHLRKSIDGRKRARTMEYIDSQVDINDDEINQTNTTHLGQRINAQIDLSASFFDEAHPNDIQIQRSIQPMPTVVVSKTNKRDSERSCLQRQTSDISLNRFILDSNKTTTELKGRDHVLRAMKSNNDSKHMIEMKNHKFIQEMLAKRQGEHEINQPLADFAFKYGVVSSHGKTTKTRKAPELASEMVRQLEDLKPTLKKRQMFDNKSPLLRIVKLESVCNQLLCYCQYIDNREDLVLFLDPNDEQSKKLAINDEIRIAGESQFNLELPKLGKAILGVTDVRKEPLNNDNNNEGASMEIHHTYNFVCSCNKCVPIATNDQDTTTTFDLRSTFPNHAKHQQQVPFVETVYDSFTLALMSTRKFDLRATIIIFESDETNHRYTFTVRDGIGNCLQIVLTNISGIQIEIQTKTYIFHQIEFVERIESPKESNRWSYENYLPPKKLFCFRSVDNQVTML